MSLDLTGIAVVLWTSRLLGIDPLIFLLEAGPIGISGISLVNS